MPNYQAELKQLPEMLVVGKEHIGPYWESAPIFQEVFQWIAANLDALKGPMIAVFYDNPKEISPEKCRSLIGAPIKEEKKSMEIPKNLKMTLMPSVDAVSVIYKGPYYSGEKYKAYGVLKEWLDKNPNYTLNNNNIIEIYQNSPLEVKEEDLITEIYMPVKKK